MVCCVLIACERPAYAYVDPGSGLFLLQGISTAFLGVLYVLRRKLKAIMPKRWKAEAEPESTNVSSEA
jgi:hypothetical protein